MYIWNEISDKNVLKGFSFSVNGSIVGIMLERRLPRSHPDFVLVRDSIINVLHQSQNKVVMESCMKAKKRPSEIYSPTDNITNSEVISKQISLAMKTVAEAIATTAEKLATGIESGATKRIGAPAALRLMANTAQQLPSMRQNGLSELEEVIMHNANQAAMTMVDLIVKKANLVADQMESGLVERVDAPSALRFFAAAARNYAEVVP